MTDIRCPDCGFVATGRNDEEALLDFTQNPRHVCDPMIAGADPMIAELQVRLMDLAESAKTKVPTVPNSCRYNCTAEGWVPFVKGGINYVRPCPLHRSGYVHPDERPPAEDPKELLREQKKRESSEWVG